MEKMLCPSAQSSFAIVTTDIAAASKLLALELLGAPKHSSPGEASQRVRHGKLSL
jgi:hypothetical protein